MNGLAGLYCYFMLLCHPWMADGGLAGWLIPSEFMDVNYGRQVKRWSLNAPVVTRRLPAEQLSDSAKWTGVSRLVDKTDAALVVGDASETTLGDLFQIKRGIATGANDFFVVSKERANELGLPWQFLTPILPSPRYLPTDEVLADENGNPRLTPQLFLVTCSLPEDKVRRDQPALWRYLETGKARGLDQRYLATHRTPWYAQEQRPAAPLLCTYMGRQTADKARPFRFILNPSRATAPNVYLMLYPKPTLAAELRRNPALLRSIWTALNALPPQALIGEGRVYGGGLHKIEPAELANAPVDGIMRLAPTISQSLGKQLSLFS